MTTLELIDYIKSQIINNVSKDLIRSKLTDVGWHGEDIEEAFSLINQQEIQNNPPSNSIGRSNPIDFSNMALGGGSLSKEDIKIDPYREIPDNVKSLPKEIETTNVLKIKDSIDNINNFYAPKIAENIPEKIESIDISTTDKNLKVEKIVTELFEDKTEGIKKEFSVVEPYKIEIKEKEKIETVPTIEEVVKKIEINNEANNLEPYKLEINDREIFEPIVPISQEIKIDEIKEEISSVEPYKIEIEEKEKIETIPPIVEKIEQEELIPTINKKPILDSVLPSNKIYNNILKNKTPDTGIKMSDMVAKNAMISSYSNDVLSANPQSENTPVLKKNKILKLFIYLFVLLIISGTVFAFIEGYVKIPWSDIKFLLVKKDPKIVLIKSYSEISNLESYKTETRIKISSSSLSSITNGLSSGENVISKDKDSITLNIKSLVNQGNENIYDSVFDLEGTLLHEKIIGQIKSNGSDLLLTVPDLTEILGENSPEPITVLMKLNDIGTLIPEFSIPAQEMIKRMDIYNISSNPIPANVKNDTALIIKDFIESLTSNNVGSENLRGIETIQYKLNSDRQSTKKLLSSMLNLYVVDLSDEEKNNLNESMGSSVFNSINVWVGKNDNHLYKIQFSLKAPLSKILWLNDSGIADDEVELEWTTEYYDLNVHNDIDLSEGEIGIDGFVQSIKDKKIRNVISLFTPEAKIFYNAVGSYGKKSNLLGSCTNPESGSLFSPIGHTKGAATAIGSISKTMNSLIELTAETSACYSTSKKWALSSQLNTNSLISTTDATLNNSFYCIDNTGSSIILSSQIKEPACK